MNESHINEEWEKEFDEKFVVQHPGDEHPFVGSWDAERGGYDFFNAYKIKAFIRTLYLQALEQGRTEGREEALKEAEKIINSQDLWLLEETAEKTESGCPAFVRINRDLVSALSKLREV